MKSISRPVIDRLPVNQLDEFACRQLDRVRARSLVPMPSLPTSSALLPLLSSFPIGYTRSLRQRSSGRCDASNLA